MVERLRKRERQREKEREGSKRIDSQRKQQKS